jgi:hypothetical protein
MPNFARSSSTSARKDARPDGQNRMNAGVGRDAPAEASPDPAIAAFVARSALIASGDAARFARLPGGVSLTCGWCTPASFCVKRALSQLRVTADWRRASAARRPARSLGRNSRGLGERDPARWVITLARALHSARPGRLVSRGHSGEPLLRRLARDTQRSANLGPQLTFRDRRSSTTYWS